MDIEIEWVEYFAFSMNVRMKLRHKTFKGISSSQFSLYLSQIYRFIFQYTIHFSTINGEMKSLANIKRNTFPKIQREFRKWNHE